MFPTTRFLRRVWSEHVAYDTLIQEATLAPLANRGIQLVVAVQPEQLHLLPRLVEEMDKRKISLGLWPLLSDEDGRWSSDTNITIYREHVLQLIDIVKKNTIVQEIVFDLEPPIHKARRLLDLKLWDGRVRFRPVDIDDAAERFNELVSEVRRCELSVTAVVAPMVLLDPPCCRGGWQQMLGTPVDGVDFDTIIVMVYSSLFEGYSKGTVSRRDSRALLARLGALAKARWGTRVGLSLGVVGGGALGDERPYRGIQELCDDVSIARAVGIDDLSLYGLAGILEHGEPAERWYHLFCETVPATTTPSLTIRSAALLHSAKAAATIFEWASRILPRGAIS